MGISTYRMFDEPNGQYYLSANCAKVPAKLADFHFPRASVKKIAPRQKSERQGGYDSFSLAPTIQLPLRIIAAINYGHVARLSSSWTSTAIVTINLLGGVAASIDWPHIVLSIVPDRKAPATIDEPSHSF